MKLAVITGASKGIGRATAAKFLANGWEVLNLSRSPLSAPGAHNLTVDLATADWGAGLLERMAALFGTPTFAPEQICLVHNAARLESGSLRRATPEALVQSLQVNVVAALELSQHLLPLMRGGSSIVYVGSTLSEKAIRGFVPYIVSKHAVLGLMRASCQDLVGKGIHTACVCPGFTDTDMLRARADEAMFDAIRAQVSFGRLIEPSEIAEVIYFCALNPVVNGATLHANLGQIER